MKPGKGQSKHSDTRNNDVQLIVFGSLLCLFGMIYRMVNDTLTAPYMVSINIFIVICDLLRMRYFIFTKQNNTVTKTLSRIIQNLQLHQVQNKSSFQFIKRIIPYISFTVKDNVSNSWNLNSTNLH